MGSGYSVENVLYWKHILLFSLEIPTVNLSFTDCFVHELSAINYTRLKMQNKVKLKSSKLTHVETPKTSKTSYAGYSLDVSLASLKNNNFHHYKYSGNISIQFNQLLLFLHSIRTNVLEIDYLGVTLHRITIIFSSLSIFVWIFSTLTK